MSAEETCKNWKQLDAKFDTASNSPLHHDNRCEFCRPKSESN